MLIEEKENEETYDDLVVGGWWWLVVVVVMHGLDARAENVCEDRKRTPSAGRDERL